MRTALLRPAAASDAKRALLLNYLPNLELLPLTACSSLQNRQDLVKYP